MLVCAHVFIDNIYHDPYSTQALKEQSVPAGVWWDSEICSDPGKQRHFFWRSDVEGCNTVTAAVMVLLQVSRVRPDPTPECPVKTCLYLAPHKGKSRSGLGLSFDVAFLDESCRLCPFLIHLHGLFRDGTAFSRAVQSLTLLLGGPGLMSQLELMD